MIQYRHFHAGNAVIGSFIGISIPETEILDRIFPFPAWNYGYRIKYLHFHRGNGVIGTFIPAASVEMTISDRNFLLKPSRSPLRRDIRFLVIEPSEKSR